MAPLAPVHWRRSGSRLKVDFCRRRIIVTSTVSAIKVDFNIDAILDNSQALASTPPGMPGTHPHQYFGWRGRQWEYRHQYYYARSDIADQY